jgi:hypothetical protein
VADGHCGEFVRDDASQRDLKARALFGCTVEADRGSVLFSDPLSEAEPETSAGAMFPGVPMDAEEAIEDGFVMLGCDADACIVDGKQDDVFPRGDRDGDCASGGCELEGIVEQDAQ